MTDRRQAVARIWMDFPDEATILAPDESAEIAVCHMIERLFEAAEDAARTSPPAPGDRWCRRRPPLGDVIVTDVQDGRVWARAVDGGSSTLDRETFAPRPHPGVDGVPVELFIRSHHLAYQAPRVYVDGDGHGRLLVADMSTYGTDTTT